MMPFSWGQCGTYNCVLTSYDADEVGTNLLVVVKQMHLDKEPKKDVS
jgi:hypothetical protein